MSVPFLYFYLFEIGHTLTVTVSLQQCFRQRGMTSKVRPERQGYDKIIYQQHVERIKKMAPTVDSGPPHEKPFSNKWELDKVNI